MRHSPLCFTDLEIGVRDKTMPNDCLHPFGKRRDPCRVNFGNDNNHIALLGGVTGLSTNDAEDLGSACFCEVNCAHEIDAYIPLCVSSTY